MILILVYLMQKGTLPVFNVLYHNSRLNSLQPLSVFIRSLINRYTYWPRFLDLKGLHMTSSWKMSNGNTRVLVQPFTQMLG